MIGKETSNIRLHCKPQLGKSNHVLLSCESDEQLSNWLGVEHFPVV